MIHLSYQERKALLFLSFLFALGLFLIFFRKTTGGNICFINLYSDKVQPRILDVNQATREELIALPVIGEKTADAIMATRTSRGGIRDFSELKKIKGINDKKLDVLRNYLSIK